MCREQAALWLTSRPQKLSNPLAQTVLFRRSSTADRPRATSINFFLPSATFVRQVGSRRDCLSCDVSVKHLQCRVWKANSLSFLWLQSRTTCRVYLRSSGCFLVLSSTTKQQQQRNSQIHCNVLKKLPPHIWISPGEEITSLQDAAERRMWINDNRQLNLISTIFIHLNVLLSHPCWLYFCPWPMFCWHSLSLFGRIFHTIPISTWWFDSFWLMHLQFGRGWFRTPSSRGVSCGFQNKKIPTSSRSVCHED